MKTVPPDGAPEVGHDLGPKGGHLRTPAAHPFCAAVTGCFLRLEALRNVL
jgi:hypothetical protein